MASLSLSGLKRRIKSVDSLSKAIKAMEVMASLKLPNALHRVESSAEYFSEIYDSLLDVSNSLIGQSHQYTKKRDIEKSCFVLISGDRGFAGGYHSSLWKHFNIEIDGSNPIIFPLGKKAREYTQKNSLPQVIESNDFLSSIDRLSMKDLLKISTVLANKYRHGEFDELVFVYTHFHSMLQQESASLQILPLEKAQDSPAKEKISVLYEPSIDSAMDHIVPHFVFGLLHGAVTQSYASEIAARKMAMDTANKNAKELRENLTLQYNRLRQETITQELSEIVSSSLTIRKGGEYA